MRLKPILLAFLSALGVGLGAATAVAETRDFIAPSVRDVRLDWCRHFGTQCGQPAADLFCREMGYQAASQFAPDPNVGARGIVTLVFGDGALCRAPTCSGFRSITCTRPDAVEAAPPPAAVVAPAPPPAAESPGPAQATPQVTARPSAQPVVTPAPRSRPTTLSPTTDTLTPAWPKTTVPAASALYPAGAELYHCARADCEFALTHDLDIDPASASQSVGFLWFVSQVEGATGARWQIAREPFPPFSGGAEDLTPDGLVAFAAADGDGGRFSVDFRELATALSGPAPDSFYVRILPLTGAGAIAGQPSNVIRVFYGDEPPPPEPITIHDTRPEPLFTTRVVSFTPPTFYNPNRWGCVVVKENAGLPPLIRSAYPVGREICPRTYRGEGSGITSFGDFVEWAANGITDAWDWLGQTYGELKQLAVTIVLDYSGFGLQCKFAAGLAEDAGANPDGLCRKAAEIAVNTGMVALGLPPSIPSYNELVDRGVEHAVDLAADAFEEQTGVPCIGPCEQALRAGFGEVGNRLKTSGYQPGCVGESEAHKHGREPLCLPPGIVAKPAVGAIDTPPLAVVEVTRRADRPPPASQLHPSCELNVGLTFHNRFPGGSVSGPTPSDRMEVAAQDISGSLYGGHTETLSIHTPQGATRTVPVIFGPKLKFVFPWTRQLWSWSQIPSRDEQGPMGPDWFTLALGATARVTAHSNCASVSSMMEAKLPDR